MKDRIILEIILPVNTEQLFHDWLNSKIHTKFTGGEARISHTVNGNFTAWDGYISGKNLFLDEGKKIIQMWRTLEFDSKDEDSQLELIFEPTAKNFTKLTLIHINIPIGDGHKYEKGWKEHYFIPMTAYYNNLKK